MLFKALRIGNRRRALDIFQSAVIVNSRLFHVGLSRNETAAFFTPSYLSSSSSCFMSSTQCYIDSKKIAHNRCYNNTNHLVCQPFSTSSKNDKDVGNKDNDISKIEVTQTSFSSSSSDNHEEVVETSSPAPVSSCASQEGDGQSHSCSTRSKSAQQIAEEELQELLSQSKQHYEHANYTEALSVSQQFLSSAIKLFGTNHPVVASAHNNVGLMNKMLGEYMSARESYHEALTIYKEIVGNDHENYAATLNNLGVLDRTQCAMDENLSFLEKMNYTDRAVEYFEQALKIREVELGKEHVYTITSRSNLGNAIAAQVIQTEVLRQKRSKKLLEEESNQSDNGERSQTSKDAAEDEKTKAIVAKYTTKKWNLAETYLRDALRVAVNNPRGKMINHPSATGPTKPKGGTARQRKMAMTNQEGGESNVHDSANTFESVLGLGIGDTSIRTLSSALAAQNLAVFLKNRADLLSSSQDAGEEMDSSLDAGDMYAEAKNLYLGAFRVRSKLKGDLHPDTVSTKFSLAELLDTLGDEDGANKLRQELLDIYQVEERDVLIEDTDSTTNNDNRK